MSATNPGLADYIHVPDWYADAACKGLTKPERDNFFAPERHTRRLAKAKTICVGCKVRETCLEHALTKPELYGVWGGTTPEEREEMLVTLGLAEWAEAEAY